MSAAEIKRQIEKDEKRKARLEAEHQAIEDRVVFLQSQVKSVAYPAQHEGDAGAKAELKAANADALRLQKSLEATDRLIGKVDAKLQALELDLKQAEADEMTVERDRRDLEHV